MADIKKLMEIFLAIAVGAILFWFLFLSDSGLGKGKEVFAKIKEKFLPDLKLGDSIKGTTPTIPENNKKEVLAFKAVLDDLKTSSTTNCFRKFQGFSAFPDVMKIELNYISGQDTTAVYVSGGTAGKNIMTDLSFTLIGIKPCVVGGGEIYTDGFYKNYLDPGTNQNKIYKDVSSITIALDDGGPLGFTENRINYGSGFTDFEGHQWLYKPDRNHICFFPTVDAGTDADGLDDDYLTDENSPDSIPYKINNNLLTQC